jgi:hypothetical protein
MRMVRHLLVGLLAGIAAGVVLGGCGSERGSGGGAVTQEQKEPEVITVQHVLVAFDGSLPGKPITRTQEEAQKLAEEIFRKAKRGADFDALVKEHTDDSHPGIYKMANVGVAADISKGIYSRGGMIPAFGDVGFALKVGEVGMARYDEQKSPYGWHIIKRIE